MKRRLKVMTKSHEFEVIIWTLKLSNRYGRISQIVNNCSAKVYFDFIGQEVNLGWKTSQPEPLNAHVPVDSGNNLREGYAEKFGVYYIDLLFWQHFLKAKDIPPSESGELFFLITYRDSDVAFIVTKEENSMIESYKYDHKKLSAYVKNQAFLLIEKDKKYTVHLRFEGDGYYEEKGKILKVKMKSWDNVELE